MSLRTQLLKKGEDYHKNRLIEKGLLKIDIPELNETIWCLPELSAKDKQKAFDLLNAKDIQFDASLLVFAACDEDGNLLFKSNDISYIHKKFDPVVLGSISSQITRYVFDMDDDGNISEIMQGGVEDALKNSEATQSSVNGPGSQVTGESL